MSAPKTVRIQFEISQALADEIELYETEAEIASHREFYANLISLWRWAARRSKEGKIIAAIHPEKLTYNEITLPALETIKLKAHAGRETEITGIAHPKAKHSDLAVVPA